MNFQFFLKNLRELNFFLGMEAYRNYNGLLLTQSKYVAELLQNTQMQDSKPR